MIGISELYWGAVEASDPLRYGRNSKRLPAHLLQFSKDKKPVIVWNVGRRCNLRCVHCYSQSQDKEYTGELTTEEGRRLIDDLAEFESRATGAFEQAPAGLRNCREASIKVGLRFTINKGNVAGIPGVFKMLRDEEIPRVCCFNLIYSGRISKPMKERSSRKEARKTVDLIIGETKHLFDDRLPKEVLTVDNHADGVYVYLRLKKEDPSRAEGVLRLLQMTGGNFRARAEAATGDLWAADPARYLTDEEIGINGRRKRI